MLKNKTGISLPSLLYRGCCGDLNIVISVGLHNILLATENPIWSAVCNRKYDS